MESFEILRTLFALGFVLALAGGIAVIIRRLGLVPIGQTSPSKRLLGIEETLNLDTRRKLVLIRAGTARHLLLLGPQAEQIVGDVSKATHPIEAQQNINAQGTKPAGNHTPVSLTIAAANNNEVDIK